MKSLKKSISIRIGALAVLVGLGAAVSSTGASESLRVEAESMSDAGQVMPRSQATGERTRWLHQDDKVKSKLVVAGTLTVKAQVRFSNDGPEDELELSIDGATIGRVKTVDTRPKGGAPGTGWNEFKVMVIPKEVKLTPGSHTIEVKVISSDAYGIEIDHVALVSEPER